MRPAVLEAFNPTAMSWPQTLDPQGDDGEKGEKWIAGLISIELG